MCESFILDSLDFTRCSLSLALSSSLSLSHPISHVFWIQSDFFIIFFSPLQTLQSSFFWPQIWTGYLLLLLLLHHLLFLLLLLFLFRLWLVSLPPTRGENKNTGAGGRIEGRWWRSLSFHVFKSSLLEFFSAQLTLDFYRGESAFFFLQQNERVRTVNKNKKNKTIWLFKIYFVCVCV